MQEVFRRNEANIIQIIKDFIITVNKSADDDFFGFDLSKMLNHFTRCYDNKIIVHFSNSKDKYEAKTRAHLLRNARNSLSHITPDQQISTEEQLSQLLNLIKFLELLGLNNNSKSLLKSIINELRYESSRLAARYAEAYEITTEDSGIEIKAQISEILEKKAIELITQFKDQLNQRQSEVSDVNQLVNTSDTFIELQCSIDKLSKSTNSIKHDINGLETLLQSNISIAKVTQETLNSIANIAQPNVISANANNGIVQSNGDMPLNAEIENHEDLDDDKENEIQGSMNDEENEIEVDDAAEQNLEYVKLTIEQARDFMIQIREKMILLHPNIPRENGLLRKNLMDCILRRRIDNRDKLFRWYPSNQMIKNVPQEHLEYLELIFNVVKCIE